MARARARVLGAVGALVTSLVIAACSGGGPTTDPPVPTGSTTPTSGSPSPADDPVTLRLAVYGDDATVTAYRRIAAAFSVANPTITVVVTVTASSGEAADAARNAIAIGKEAPDVFLLDRDELPALAADGLLQPVNELLEDRDVPFGDGVQRVGLDAFSVNAGLACMPADVSPQVVFYNRRLIHPRQLLVADGQPDPTPGVAESWDWLQFVAATRQAVAAGVTAVYLPPDLRVLAPLLRSGGGPVVDDQRTPTTLTLSNEATRDALKTIAATTRRGRVALTPTQAERIPPLERFESGDLAMMLGTRSLVPQLRHVPGLRFDVAPLPGIESSRTVADISGLCIPVVSTHPEEAADLIAFAVNGRGAEIAAASGSIVPSSLEVLHSDEFLQADQLPQHAQVFSDSAGRAEPEPFSVNWLEAAALAGDVLTEVMYGDVDVTSPETPELDALLLEADRQSQEVLRPVPEETVTP